MSLESSKPSSAAWVLCRKRSRYAVGIWALQLVVLGCAALVLGAPPYVKVLACGAALALGLVTWPRPPPELVYTTARDWAVPALDLEHLRLGPGTAYTRHWALLELVGGAGIRRELIWADELDRIGWRRLQLLLREPTVPASRGNRAAARPGRVGRLDANSHDR